jgi:hypothetical protein
MVGSRVNAKTVHPIFLDLLPYNPYNSTQNNLFKITYLTISLK